jgi:Zn-dependent protease with chaperone function
MNEPTDAGPGPDRPPGPADRRTFDEAQRRHRRATWLVVALCGATVAGMGVVVGGLLVPLLVAMVGYGFAVGGGVLLTVTLVPLGLASLVVPALLPVFDVVAALVDVPVRVVPRLVGDVIGWFVPDDSVGQAAVTVLPGVVLVGLAWLLLHRLFERAGTGGAVLALGARPPRPGDLEEQQLVNLVAEMAIAAGVPAPRVLVLDGERPNAACVGRSPDDATVVVGRRILDELDRDATQGLVAHLVGSVANGDLRIAFVTVSVFKTFGLVLTLLDAAVSPAARLALGRLRRFARDARDPAAPAGDADLVAALLAGGTSFARLDDANAAMQRALDGMRGGGFLNPLRMARLGLFLPYVLVSLVMRVVLVVTIGLLLGPLVALAWRARRYLADATAVQLTRYPDGLARGLAWLVDHGATVRGAEWAAHLFVVGPGRKAAGDGDAPTFARQVGIPIDFHPPLPRRLRRLARMGASR